MTSEVFNEKNYFLKLLNREQFDLFMEKVTGGYNRKIPYHNDLHAADVFQTVYIMVTRCDLEEVSL